MSIEVTNEVYLKSDPSIRGVVVKVEGQQKITVAWFGSTEKPTQHAEDDLVCLAQVHSSVHNVAINPTGFTVQAGRITGNIVGN